MKTTIKSGNDLFEIILGQKKNKTMANIVEISENKFRNIGTIYVIYARSEKKLNEYKQMSSDELYSVCMEGN